MQLVIRAFTWIELIFIIFICITLTATIMSRAISYSNAKQVSHVQQIAMTLTSMASLNHVGNIAYDTGLTETQPKEVYRCSDVANLLTDPLGPDFLIRASLVNSIGNDPAITEGNHAECFLAYRPDNIMGYKSPDILEEPFIAYGVRN